MPGEDGMTNKGLSKLTEELGELSAVVGKKLARMNTDKHWDQRGNLSDRLREEMGDVLGAMRFVAHQFPDINFSRVEVRANYKYKLFCYWDAGGMEKELPSGWSPGDPVEKHPGAGFHIVRNMT